MKEVLFNGHDIVLMLIIGFSLLLAVRIVSSTTMAQNVRVLLAAFWGLNALWAVDTLVFWSEPIRVSAFDHSAWLPLAFNFAPFLQGPILFLLTKAMQKPSDPLSAKYLWHFLPALLTPFYLYWACYRFPVQQQSILIVNLEILASGDVCFLWFLTLKKLTPVAYGIICLLSLYRWHGVAWVRNTSVDVVPLLYVIMPMIWLWVAITHILGQWLPFAVSDVLGVFGNYFLLALVSKYLFHRAGDSAMLIKPAQETPQLVTVAETHPPEIQYSRVTIQSHHDKAVRTVMNFMVNRYADSDISLKMASAVTGVSRGKLNAILKQETGLTFSGYLNQLRLTEAARLLRDDQSLNVSEIALSIGYNNVTYFNKLFKSQYAMTPNEFRSGKALNLAIEAHSY